MKRFLWSLAIVVLATPVFAQEIDLGLGGDVGGLLNIPAPSGRGAPARGAAPAAGARGAAPPRGTAPNAPPVDRLVRLREMLAAANTPLLPPQETGLNALLNAEIPLMRQQLQARILKMQGSRGGATGPAPAAASPAPPPAAAAPATPGVPPGVAAGPRGMPPNINLPSMDELAPEIIRLNDQLLGKIADAPVLTPPQQTLIKKLYKDQVKSRGGFDAIRLTMEDAAAPFSPEQVEQIQPLFDAQTDARAQLVRDAQGQPPDKAKLDQLQRDTLAKVLKLLTAPQRTALLTSAPKAP